MSLPNEVNLSNQHTAVVRLDDERKALRMPIYDMETNSGVSLNSFYAWKRNIRSASLPNLVAVAETLGFEVIMRRRTVEKTQ